MTKFQNTVASAKEKEIYQNLEISMFEQAGLPVTVTSQFTSLLISQTTGNPKWDE